MDEDWLVDLNNKFFNPEPIVLEETDILLNDFLSPAKLQEISGQRDLTTVETLEMVVDTSETTLGNFGQYLPSLMQLKLSDSIIPSVRDIGTSFGCLTILWMSRCGLNDIDGIASMQRLQELYVAYNNIDDISSISFLDSLEVLDIEGNKIADIGQIDFLSIMPSLTTLTLAGNPVCQNFKKKSGRECTYREYMLEKLPQLEQLDDESSSADMNASRPETALSSHSQEDIDIITNAIKEGMIEDLDEDDNLDVNSDDNSLLSSRMDSSSSDLLPASFSTTPLRKFKSARPSTALPSKRSLLASENAKFTPSLIQPRPGSSGSESGMLQQDDSSTLTFGDPICGNPIHALLNRKKTPLPVMTILNKEMDNLTSQRHISRPSTSLGLRRPFKVTSEDRRNSMEYDIPDDSNAVCRSYRLASEMGPAQHLREKLIDTDEGTRAISSGLPDQSERLHLQQPILNPSPLLIKPSSPNSRTSPFASPTPPLSPQRPQSARDIRSHFRRSFSSGTSRSVNVMTLNVSTQYKPRDPVVPPIEDRST